MFFCSFIINTGGDKVVIEIAKVLLFAINRKDGTIPAPFFVKKYAFVFRSRTVKATAVIQPVLGGCGRS